MKDFGLRTYNLSSLRLPGNWLDILESEGARSKVGGVKEFGLLSPPMVRMRDRLLVTGHERVAAVQLSGKGRVRCIAIDCTDEEAAKLANHEHAFRQPTEPNYVTVSRLVEQYIEEFSKQVLPANKSITPRSLAIKHVASLHGVSVQTVRQYLTRAKKGLDMSGRCPVNRLGADLDPEWLDGVLEAHRRCISALRGVQRAQRQLSALGDYPGIGRVQAAIKETEGLIRAVRGLTPKTVCPDCLCSGDDCPTCEGWGFLTAFDAQRRSEE